MVLPQVGHRSDSTLTRPRQDVQRIELCPALGPATRRLSRSTISRLSRGQRVLRCRPVRWRRPTSATTNSRAPNERSPTATDTIRLAAILNGRKPLVFELLEQGPSSRLRSLQCPKISVSPDPLFPSDQAKVNPGTMKPKAVAAACTPPARGDHAGSKAARRSFVGAYRRAPAAYEVLPSPRP